MFGSQEKCARNSHETRREFVQQSQQKTACKGEQTLLISLIFTAEKKTAEMAAKIFA